MTISLSSMVTKILSFKSNGATTLTFRSHLTLLVAWQFYSRWTVSCWNGRLMVTMRLS